MREENKVNCHCIINKVGIERHRGIQNSTLNLKKVCTVTVFNDQLFDKGLNFIDRSFENMTTVAT